MLFLSDENRAEPAATAQRGQSSVLRISIVLRVADLNRWANSVRPRNVLLAIVLPPLAMIPLYAIFMVVIHRIDLGTWLPFPNLTSMFRTLGFAYLLGLVFHVFYSTLIYFVGRFFGVRSLFLWIAAYAVPLVILIFWFSETTSGLIDGAVHVCFGVAIAFAAWPFVKMPLAYQR